MEPDKIKIECGSMIEDVSLDKTKASSEETLSCGDVNSFKSFEGKEISSVENTDDQNELKAPIEGRFTHEAKDQPTLFRPVARVSAFNVYNSSDSLDPASSFSRTVVPMQGPLIQASKPDADFCKLFEGVNNERLVPHNCGYGCCETQSDSNPQSSLLGPEFVEFAESASFPSFELAAIATDISNLAWLKSGLDHSSVRAVGNAAGRTMTHGSQVPIGRVEESRVNNSFCFDDANNRLMDMKKNVLST